MPFDIFDGHCIRTWLSSSRKCPCCLATASGDHLVKMHFDFLTPAVEATAADAVHDEEDDQEKEDVEMKSKDSSKQEVNRLNGFDRSG